MPLFLELLTYYVIAINLVAYALFWSDKRRAINGDWRVPERDLLITAFMGGWIGAKIAQTTLRHKSRKMTFRMRLNGIPLLWGLLCLAALPQAREGVITVINTVSS